MPAKYLPGLSTPASIPVLLAPPYVPSIVPRLAAAPQRDGARCRRAAITEPFAPTAAGRISFFHFHIPSCAHILVRYTAAAAAQPFSMLSYAARRAYRYPCGSPPPPPLPPVCRRRSFLITLVGQDFTMHHAPTSAPQYATLKRMRQHFCASIKDVWYF